MPTRPQSPETLELPGWFPFAHRLTSLLLLLMVITSSVGLAFLGFDDDLENLFQGDSRDYRDYLEHTEIFGATGNQCVVLLTAPDVLSADSLSAIRRIHQKMVRDEELVSVNSMCDLLLPRRVGRMFFPAIPFGEADAGDWKMAREVLQVHPLGNGILYSSDFRHTLLVFEIQRGTRRDREAAKIDSIREMIRSEWCKAESSGVKVTGLPVIRLEVIRCLQRDQAKFTVLGFLFALIVGWVLFRKLMPVMFVAMIPFVGLGCIMGLLGWLSIPLNIVNNVITPLVLVIGFAETIHVLFLTGAFIGQGDGTGVAVLKMIRRLMVPCFLAALTTAIGFGSLFLAEDRALREFAMVASVSSLIMFLVVLLVSACLLASPLGRHCVHDRRPARRDANQITPRGVTGNRRWPMLVSLLVVVLNLLLAWLASRNGTDYRLTENLPKSNVAVQSLHEIDRVMGGSSRNHLQVRFRKKPKPGQLIQTLDTICRRLEQSPIVSRTNSFLNLLESMPGPEGDPIRKFRELRHLPQEAWEPYLQIDPTVANINLMLPDIGSRRLGPHFEAIHERVQKDAGGAYQARLVGLNVLASRRSQKMIRDLVWSLLGASLVIFGLILLVYRSPVFGLAAILVNAFPILGVAALMSWNQQPIQYTGIMLLCTCLGLAVDDTVHYLSKLRWLLDSGLEMQRAVQETTRQLWPVLMSTSLILGVGFGLAATSDIPTFQTFGGYASVALTLALIGDLFFLPHLLVGLSGLTNKSRQNP
ncbi:MAG: MMPL family transporter [Planctomycetota bacterium]|nr:MMPL family transporter [Planctomycetota bacterium]